MSGALLTEQGKSKVITALSIPFNEVGDRSSNTQRGKVPCLVEKYIDIWFIFSPLLMESKDPISLAGMVTGAFVFYSGKGILIFHCKSTQLEHFLFIYTFIWEERPIY